TLQLGNGGASGSIAGNVTNNGTFAINRSDTFTFGGIISGSGAFQQNGAGTTIFTAANTYTGGTTINAGTLQLGSGGSLAPTGALTINAGGTFNLNSFNQTGRRPLGHGRDRARQRHAHRGNRELHHLRRRHLRHRRARQAGQRSADAVGGEQLYGADQHQRRHAGGERLARLERGRQFRRHAQGHRQPRQPRAR